FFISGFHRFILSVLILYVLAGVAITPFHADEADHLFKSQDYVAYFVLFDPLRLRVDPPVAVNSPSHIRLLTGTTSAYVTGLMLWHTEVKKWPSAWVYPQSVDTNRQAGRWPEKEILWRGRLASAFLTMLSVTLVYKLGEKLAPRAGIFSAAFFALHPVILLNGRRVMQEGSLLFFTLLVVWQGIRMAENPTRKNGLILGAVIGLALASKLTALLAIVGVVFGVVLSQMLALYSLRLKFGYRACHALLKTMPLRVGAGVEVAPQPSPALVYTACTAILIYLLLTPAIWNNPPARLLLAARLRQDVLRGQAAASMETYETFWQHWTALSPYPRTIQYYESPDFADDWQIRAEIKKYQQSLWRGFHLPTWAGTGLILLGGAVLLRRPKTPAHFIIRCWLITTVVGIVLTVPLGWQRYYLPWMLVGTLLMGLGLDFLARSVQSMGRGHFYA
ncbi:MAG: glycosyltransferase family 39 protein, partial [Anaerolineae bacterium]|nr:glycosyltransferase family 39 protein [Anaerolineae bacterium]